jgi:hypothetical protein
VKPHKGWLRSRSGVGILPGGDTEQFCLALQAVWVSTCVDVLLHLCMSQQLCPSISLILLHHCETTQRVVEEQVGGWYFTWG